MSINQLHNGSNGRAVGQLKEWTEHGGRTGRRRLPGATSTPGA